MSERLAGTPPDHWLHRLLGRMALPIEAAILDEDVDLDQADALAADEVL